MRDHQSNVPSSLTHLPVKDSSNGVERIEAEDGLETSQY
jgi:hypothetical protein